MVDYGEEDPALLDAWSWLFCGTGFSCTVSALVRCRFFLLQQVWDRQVRQRSLPHHWQEKQSGQGFFFLPVLLSGT
jgi:hypothetical protein